jgi:ribonuclease Z
MQLTILGNNSALPANGRHPTAQILEVREQLILIDCGENTQVQMQRYNIRRRRINYIFISHLHGDHYFGLIGLISSMGLGGRTEPLHLYGPPMLKDIIDIQLHAAHVVLPFEIKFHPIEPAFQGVLLELPYLTVSCFPTEHRIACHGFLFESGNKYRKLNPEACRSYEIPTAYYPQLKRGKDYLRRDGLLVKNEWVTAAPQPLRSYAYCADTIYTESFLPFIKQAQVIYHESTYLNNDEEKAKLRFHTTAAQAATLATKASVGKLLLGHYSSKYERPEWFEQEARVIFSESYATYEGMRIDI